MSRNLSAAWSRMPSPAAERLLLGATGRHHLLDAAGRALASLPGLPADLCKPCLDLCRGLLLEAWAADPLDGELAAMFLNLPMLAETLPKPGRAALIAAVAAWRRPETLDYFARIAARRDMDKLRHFLCAQMEKDPGNLFWFRQAASLGAFEGDWAFVDTSLAAAPEALAPLAGAVLAEVALLRGDRVRAARGFAAMEPVFGKAAAASRLAAAEEGDAAIRRMAEALAADPWRSNLILTLYDRLTGRSGQTAPLPGRTRILLYTWNKAEDLAATLESLFAADLAGAEIAVLDNGSTDATPEVLASWRDRFGPALTRLRLPVNAGAAAARNWLMHLPESRSADFLLYLDDDAAVPPDFLGRLGAAVAHYPAAGVWGCKVCDAAAPALIQAADLHLVYPPEFEAAGPEADLTRREPNPFRTADLHAQVLDMGQFDHLRPCAAVTGCCHLFRTERLLEVGDFNLRLSPSQYDDLERDLRMNAAGSFAVCQGHLRVLHRKRTGAASRLSASQAGNAAGNRYKMQVLHPRSEILASMAAEREVLAADLAAKTTWLEDNDAV